MAQVKAGDIGNAIGNAISNIGTYSARAASRANGVSAAAQSAQGAFNSGQASIANSIGDSRLASQYGFNSSQAAMANQFTSDMWDRSAAWNEMMWERQAEFNHNEAKLAREWQERMMNTAYQRATADMKAAGLNPVLAATSGIDTSTGGGAVASVGGAQMSSAQGAMANGGLLQGNMASESSYSGQMEYLSGTLGLISAVIGGISSAAKGLGSLGDIGREFGNAIGDILKDPSDQVEFQWLPKGSTTHKTNGTEKGGSHGTFGNKYGNYYYKEAMKGNY